MSYTTEIDTSRSFDSRDIDARIEALQDEREEAETSGNPNAQPLNEADLEELAALIAFRDEVGSDEWGYGISFIPENDFVDYAEELARDIHGDAIYEGEWPMSHIDWDAAANSLRMDYSEIDLDGTTFLYRG